MEISQQATILLQLVGKKKKKVDEQRQYKDLHDLSKELNLDSKAVAICDQLNISVKTMAPSPEKAIRWRKQAMAFPSSPGI